MDSLFEIFNILKEVLIYIFSFIFILSIPVFLHELGHYLAALSCGVKVEKFYIGFDFFGLGIKKKINDTEYGIGLFPLGGYVKLAGIIDENMTDDNDENISIAPEHQFKNKNLLQKLWILSAGVIMNFILSFIILFMFGIFFGDIKPKSTPIVNSVMKEIQIYDENWDEKTLMSPAYEVGLRPGDYMIKYETKNEITEIAEMTDLLNKIGDKSINDEQIRIHYYRPNIEIIDDSLYSYIDSSTYADLANNSNAYNRNKTYTTDWFKPIKVLPTNIFGTKKVIGMGYGTEPVQLNIFEAFLKANIDLFNIIDMTAKSLFGLLSGEIPTKHLSGIIGIGKAAGDTAKSSAPILSLVSLMAFISANLGFINILPIPGLDGGHAFLETLQGFYGKQFSIKTKMKIQVFGMLLIFSLFLFTIFNDIRQLIFN